MKTDGDTAGLLETVRHVAHTRLGRAGPTMPCSTWSGTRGSSYSGRPPTGPTSSILSALIAAAARPDLIRAVVSRGGRPDLAGSVLRRVRAPTLLIVGGDDHVVVQLNQVALEELQTEARLVIVPGATHRFDEPGALDEVARLARAWFERHLTDGG